VTRATIDRRAVSLPCRLSRATGSPIAARAVELRTHGLRVVAQRPLALDETLRFELGDGDLRIEGRARVICQERPDAYALRFVALSEQMARRVHGVVAADDEVRRTARLIA